MDPRLLKHYNRELQHIREMGAEFAEEFPKIAGRLGLEGLQCADPYVERLLEGFAFLAARVQLKLESQFPSFTRHLLEMVLPHYLCPTPSMAVVQLRPDLTEGALAEGYVVPRSTVLRSALGIDDQTACEYRTAHEVTLWPLEIVEAEYLGTKGSLGSIGLTELGSARAAIRIRLRTTAGLTFEELPLDRLCIYLQGADALPMQLHEQLLANPVSVVVQPTERKPAWREVIDRAQIRRVGFEDEQALLPFGPRSFQGYRLLHEYFAFPKRYLFVEFAGLGPAVRRAATSELDLVVLLDRSEPNLERAIDADNFALFCTPSVNLFPMRAGRIHLDDRQSEFHVLPDRSRPMDFEVYAVTEVVGIGTSSDDDQKFLPFYAALDNASHSGRAAFFTLQREPRQLSSKQRRTEPRSSYIGSEVFVSLVDGKEAPYRSSLRQVALGTLCTNRDLPLHMSVGKGETDFTLESGAPVESVRCLAGPTRPRPSVADGESAWRLISHLSLNYLSLVDNDEEHGAAALRDLFLLYADDKDAAIRKQIEGVKSVTSQAIHRRLPTPGPITFGRGLEISVTCDESAFEGTGITLLGSVLEEFFTRYVSINSFTETVIRSLDRGEIIRWPARIGRRHTL